MTTLKTNKVAGLNGTNAIDGSVFFDGVSRLELDGSSDFAFGTGDFTIEMWIKILLVKKAIHLLTYIMYRGINLIKSVS